MQRGETGHRGPERVGPDELNAARLRLLITDALAQLSAEHREVISRSYYLGRANRRAGCVLPQLVSSLLMDNYRYPPIK
jgi:DNA-directed RNA polymerase specialized sigma24 family protein